MITELQHARIRLALHRLRGGVGTSLLLLHELGGSAADWRLADLAWTGPVYALDLSGHGHSGRIRGGGYLAERWAADADAALRELQDDAWLVGAGVSAYSALLLAGARPESVRGAVLLPGRGLVGAGPEPDFTHLPPPMAATCESGSLRRDAATDPAVGFSETSVRPPDQARCCAESAGPLLLCEDGTARPPWWSALHGLPNVRVHQGIDLAPAFAKLVEHSHSLAKRNQRSA
jgi:pimeloyl-ACP methyl ester carboxylesterase